jgi:type IV pilus assembly protein PilN
MIRINLAPAPERRRGAGFQLALPSFNLGMVFLIVYGVAFLGMGAYWKILSSAESRLTTSIHDGQRELDALKIKIGKLGKVKELHAELQKRVAAIEALTKDQGRPIMLVDAFADMVPRDLWITGIEERSSTLKVSGTAFSTTAVADLMSNLRASGRFKEVDIVVSRQDLTKSPRLVTFEVTCRFEL